ncbi:MAG: hypothetical protein AAF502_16305 [Bacteroidota bacterium]
MIKQSRYLAFTFFIFAGILLLSIPGLGKKGQIKAAFSLQGFEENPVQKELVIKSMINSKEAKLINLHKRSSELRYSIKPEVDRIKPILENLWRHDIPLYIRLEVNVALENMVDFTVYDCELGMPIYFQSIPYSEEEDLKFRKELLYHIRNVTILRSQGIQSFVFFDHPALEVEYFEHVYFQRACYYMAEQILSHSNSCAVLPNRFRNQVLEHPALREGFDIPVKAISFSFLKISDNAVFNFMHIKKLAGDEGVPEKTEHLVSEKHFREFFFYEMPELFNATNNVTIDWLSDWLAENVDAYAKVGAYDISTNIRECLAFISPNEPLDRRLLIKEYGKWFHQYFPSVIERGNWQKHDPEILPEVYRRVGGYIRQVNLAQSILDQESLSLEEQAKVAWKVPAKALMHRISYYIFDGKRHGENLLYWAEEKEEAFLLNYYPQPWVNQITNNWLHNLMRAAILRVDRPYRTSADLDFLYKVITEVVPDHWETYANLSYWFKRAWKDEGILKNTYTIEEYEQFLANLIHSGNEVAALYGGYGIIMMKWDNGQNNNLSSQDLLDLKSDIDTLMMTYRQTPYLEGIRYSRKGEKMYRSLEYAIKDINQRLALPIKN